MNTNKRHLIISSLITLAPIALGGILWHKLPAQMPLRFSLYGEPHAFVDKVFGVLALPIVMLLAHWLVTFAMHRGPKGKEINPKLANVLFWLLPCLSFLVQTSILLHTANILAVRHWQLYLTIAAVFILLGNYLPKTQPNNTIGIRLSSTKASTANWEKTHRLAGRLMVSIGLCHLLLPFVGESGIWISIVLLLIAATFPLLYSYRLARQLNT